MYIVTVSKVKVGLKRELGTRGDSCNMLQFQLLSF